MLLGEVIVGSCIHALLKSHKDKIPILIDSMNSPPDHQELPFDISVAGITTGHLYDAWSILKFSLSMEGLVINPSDLEYVRVEEDTVSSKGVRINFTKCHLFPSKKVKTDLEIKKIQDEGLYKVVDFMRLKTGSVTNISTVYLKDTFIESIKLLNAKNIMSLSTLTKEQLTDFDYSDTIVKFISQKELSDNENIHRPPIRKGSIHRRNLKIEVMKRDVESLEENVYKSSKRVKYYDRKKRNDILKAYRRDNSSL